MASPHTYYFPGGRAVIDWTETNDHVVIMDTDGTVLTDFSCAYPPGYHWFVGLFRLAKDALLDKDGRRMAKLVHFPLRVNGGSIPAPLTGDELGARFETIFSPAFIEKIRNTEPSMLSCRNGTQAKLGDGLLWADLYGKQPLVNAVNH